MLSDFDFYIDPDEDEVVFAPVFKCESRAFKRIESKVFQKKTPVSVQISQDEDEDKENCNENVKVVDSTKPLKYGLGVKASPKRSLLKDFGEINWEETTTGLSTLPQNDILEILNATQCTPEDEYLTERHNTTPVDEYEYLAEIEPAQESFSKIVNNLTSDRNEEKISSESLYEPPTKSADQSNYVDSEHQPAKNLNVSCEDLFECAIENAGKEEAGSIDEEFDKLVQSCNMNESQMLWCSTDVNVLLDSLTLNVGDITLDDNDDVSPATIEVTSTPLRTPRDGRKIIQKTPTCMIDISNRGNTHSHVKGMKIPNLIITEATPSTPQLSSPAVEKFNLPLGPSRSVKLVFRDDAKNGNGESDKGSSSSGSFQSCGSPHATPFVKPGLRNIPKKPLSARKIPTQKSFTDRKEAKPVDELRLTSSVSRIPKKADYGKTSAAKSLQFSHIASPITKYIHQKATPLVHSVQAKRGLKLTPVDEGKPSAIVMPTPVSELQAIRYRKGIPLVQEKKGESRLPRLGPNQVGSIKPLSPRIVKHQSRLNNVSILVSSEAKIADPIKKF